ncbi:tRNA uridine-5-carboxymethylaminomethyl(34) synthesis GTPase MnmE [Mycoplasma sp. ATU-Cv-508]|uniref:tRNA uridine-5-carboxymethylaminomethyl(34) synthesis GTPase MnmE n=1 Tax=Mycoplasma sp. ATU-Cv-508 TaxID=2048001 RepID=UPI000FDDE054
MFDTISALSTAPVNQPIAIIRLSGPDTFSVVRQIFRGKIGAHQSIKPGLISDGDEVIDQVLVAFFQAPSSFTGEDMAEIYVHGGVVNAKRVLELTIKKGARLANRGEFSHRAFLNGKIDLIQAQAIHDLIFAKTLKQAQISAQKLTGQTSQLIENMLQELSDLIAVCEVNIDYPEHDDVQQISDQKLIPIVSQLLEKLTRIENESRQAQSIYQGIQVAIVGLPNSGKSSLLNALIDQDKAIVSNLPGTTRDVVEGQIVVGDILIKLSDTAGIRATDDELEKTGVSKSYQTLSQADLVLHVIDAKVGESDFDKLIEERVLADQIYLKVFNKSDLLTEQSHEKDKILVSAQLKQTESLVEAIKDKCQKTDLSDLHIFN